MFASALLLPLLLSAVPTFGSRLSSRNLFRRAPFSDTCATPSGQLTVPDLNTGIPTSVGVVNTCLCTNNIPVFLQSTPLGQSAVAVGGQAAASAALLGLINVAPNVQVCNYPDHAVQACTNANPCAFVCGDGFVLAGNACVCPAPNTDCNGVCGFFPNGCPSIIPRRDSAFHARQVERTCAKGQRVCEVVGGTAKDWECVDTDNDLESCGGCSQYSRTLRGPIGVDCTSIPHVSDVACVKGSCDIKRCTEGFEVAANQTTCVQSAVDEDAKRAALVRAVEYGFENLIHWS